MPYSLEFLLPFICKSEWSRIKRISLVATPFVNSKCALRSKNHLAFTPISCSRSRRVASSMNRRNVACNRWIVQTKMNCSIKNRKVLIGVELGHSFRIFFWEFSSGKLVPDTKTLEKKETKARWHFSSFGNDNYIIHQCHIFLHVAWKFLFCPQRLEPFDLSPDTRKLYHSSHLPKIFLPRPPTSRSTVSLNHIQHPR